MTPDIGKVRLELKVGVKSKKMATVSLDLRELIARYQISNQAEGKSPKTVRWYTAMLRAFGGYLAMKHNLCDLTAFDVDKVRAYILYLNFQIIHFWIHIGLSE